MGVIKRNISYELDNDAFREAIISEIQTEYPNVKPKNVKQIRVEYSSDGTYKVYVYIEQKHEDGN